jgi:guanylate kinase
VSSTGDWDDLPGRLIVISGPSGSGKSTLVRRALERPGVRARLSVSATTRPARPGEEHGRDYFFMSREAFEQEHDRGGFLEWAAVHGNLYGTPAGPVREELAAGYCVVLEIDVQGALLVRQRVPSALLVFVNVPSVAELERRLRERGTDSESSIERRLATAHWELEQAPCYDHQLMNRDLDQAVDDLVALLVQQGCGG